MSNDVNSMNSIEHITKKLKEEALSKQHEHEASIELSIEKYKHLNDKLVEMKDQNTECDESIIKYLHELIKNKNVLYKIVNDKTENNSGLPIAIQNQELFVKFMFTATDALNKASTTTSLLEQSSADNHYEL